MAADAQVLDLVRQHNKPFNAVGIGDFLAAKGIKKAAVQRALDALAAAGKLTAKDFGKTKIYLPPQDGLAVLSREELEARRGELKAVQQRLADERRALKEREDELRAWEASLTVEQLRAQTAELRAKTEAQEAKLARLRGGAVLVTADERAAVEAALEAAISAWRKRRGIFRGAWDAVAEGIEGNDADIFEGMGVETDDAAGGPSLAEVAALLPQPGKRRK